jgi:hypothetical protein
MNWHVNCLFICLNLTTNAFPGACPGVNERMQMSFLYRKK